MCVTGIQAAQFALRSLMPLPAQIVQVQESSYVMPVVLKYLKKDGHSFQKMNVGPMCVAFATGTG